MAGHDHLPAIPDVHDGAQTIARNARYGLVLFAPYLLLYGGYMLINAFQPSLMDSVLFAGINLAIVYGLGLIGAALFLALVYGWLCRSPVSPAERREGRA